MSDADVGARGVGARDGKLNRDVALEVLSDVFAADGERLERFTREAHARPNASPSLVSR